MTTQPSTLSIPRQLPLALLALRIGMVIALLPWVADKFIRPAHAVGIFESFYGVGGVAEALVYGVGAVQVLILALFALGIARTWTYGLVLLMHAATTLISWKQYLHPYEGANILFFAAWPMLAACFALFLLRRHDTLGTVGRAPTSESTGQ